MSAVVSAHHKALHNSVRMIYGVMFSPVLYRNQFFAMYRKSCFFSYFLFGIACDRLIEFELISILLCFPALRIVVYYALPFLKTATKGTGGFMENLLSGVDPAAESFMFTMVIIAFVLNYAAYFAEIFRGGIESIPKGQYEAAAALGMTKAQTFFRIILPQVIKRIVPASSNEVITLVKDTSLANVVAYSEIMLAAKQQMMNYSSLVPLFIAGVFYFVMATVLTALFGFIEKKLNYYR